MAHRGEQTNGRHYAQARGFNRLKPAKTKEEEDAEKVLRDFEAGKYGPPVEEPVKEPVKTKDPYEGLDEVEKKEMQRREAIRKAVGGR